MARLVCYVCVCVLCLCLCALFVYELIYVAVFDSGDFLFLDRRVLFSLCESCTTVYINH